MSTESLNICTRLSELWREMLERNVVTNIFIYLFITSYFFLWDAGGHKIISYPYHLSLQIQVDQVPHEVLEVPLSLFVPWVPPCPFHLYRIGKLRYKLHYTPYSAQHSSKLFLLNHIRYNGGLYRFVSILNSDKLI